jgi:hypothetical protein
MLRNAPGVSSFEGATKIAAQSELACVMAHFFLGAAQLQNL